MSETDAPVTETPAPNGKELQAQIASMQAEIARLQTNPRNLPTIQVCNVCGETVADGKRCARHPYDKVNHIREALPEEEGSGKGALILVKQV